MPVIAFALFIGVGFIQFFAIIAGIKAWLGFPTILAVLVALLTTYFPVVGQALGVYGAINVWHWPWWLAVILFFGTLIFVFAAGGLAVILEKLR